MGFFIGNTFTHDHVSLVVFYRGIQTNVIMNLGSERKSTELSYHTRGSLNMSNFYCYELIYIFAICKLVELNSRLEVPGCLHRSYLKLQGLL